jgi:serine/threonine-protein kinase
MTPAASTSGWVKHETDVAIGLEHEEQVRLLPLLVQACATPMLLRAYHRVDFTERYERGLAQLMDALSPQEPAWPARVADAVVSPAAAPASPASAPDRLVFEQPFHLELVRVPAGDFLMGSDPTKDKIADSDEEPQHHVYLDEFYIGRYPVTNAQYSAYVKARKIKFEAPNGKDDHPVVEVSWDDAVAFCEWLSKETGKVIRLPTEAEWEKAARGTDGRIYPWGNPLYICDCDPRWGNTWESGILGTTPVGKYSPGGDSPYGAADMAGNVWEWTAGWYNAYDYTSSPAKNPAGPSSGGPRVLRGGAWCNPPNHARAAYRSWNNPDYRNDHIGFRVVAAPIR